MVHTVEPHSRHADYTVACICPMGVELAPVEAILDEIHDPLPTSRDQNAYTLGRIGEHNVVIAIMPEIGNNAAATTATQLLNDFPSIRFGLLVGIGGGAPGEVDVRLGDVVVSQPTATSGGVVQYDMGKVLEGGQFQRTGLLQKPPTILSTSVRKLDSQHRRLGHNLLRHVSEMFQKFPAMRAKYSMPIAERDQLFRSSYNHQTGPTCEHCDEQQTVRRPDRTSSGGPSHEPEIHYGTVGSANVVVKDALLRDKLQQDMHILCVEMEAAGLMNDFPCLVIRGICDYADSHKNKKWQPYAAAVAAAYMKELLLVVPARQVAQTTSAMEGTVPKFRFGVNIDRAPGIDAELFVGREQDLQEMAKVLLPDPGLNVRKTAIVGGLGGIGKTQLTIQFIKRHGSSYDSVFWLNASSETTLNESLRLTAARIGIIDSKKDQLDEDQIRVQVLNWFSAALNSRWLLVFDNYDDIDLYDITRSYPFAWQGSVIVTTRSPETLSGAHVYVGRMRDISDALRILETRSRRKNIRDDTHALQLAERMKGLPLALATAGFYLRHSPISFGEYLRRYEEQWPSLREVAKELPEYQARTLYTTWDLSLVQIQNTTPDAAKLLTFLAYLDNQDIWYQLLAAGNATGVPAWYSNLTSSPLHFENAMRTLVDFGLAEVHVETASYSFHACVHDWMLHALNQELDRDQFRLALSCVVKAIRGTDLGSMTTLADRQRLTLHCANLCRNQFQGLLTCEDMQREGYDDLITLSALLEAQNKVEQAKSLRLQALAGYERILGAEHPETLIVLVNLGLLYFKRGQTEQASTSWTRALAGLERVFEPDHPETLMALQNLGIVYQRRGQTEQAEKMWMRALAGYEKHFEPDHHDTLLVVQNLGMLYYRRGQMEQGERMLIRALAGFEKCLEPDHPDILLVVQNLGMLYYRRGQIEQAEKMWMRALRDSENSEFNDPLTITTITRLCTLYETQNKFVEAAAMCERGLQAGINIGAQGETLTMEAAGDLSRLILRWSIKYAPGSSTTDNGLAIAELGKLARDWGALCFTIYGKLGRMLLRVSDNGNANIAFQQQIKIQGNERMFSNVLCDVCRRQTSCSTRRFVCRRCLDVDLCGQCHETLQPDTGGAPYCFAHAFFEVRQGVLSPSISSISYFGKKASQLWLEQLLKKSSAIGKVKSMSNQGTDIRPKR